MIEILWTTLILLGVTLTYYCVISPWKQYRHYVRSFQNKGYRVNAIPFVPFFVPLFLNIRRGTKAGDPMNEIKKIHMNKDVVITNAFNKIIIDMNHPDLIREFYDIDRIKIYIKSKALTAAISRAMGQGIPFSQGEVWKRKRRIINKVFNFDFIKSMTEKIKDISIKSIHDIESESIKLQNGYEYEILNLNTKIFSNIILECFLGGAAKIQLDGKPVSQFVNNLMTDSTKRASSLAGLFFGKKYLNLGVTSLDRQLNNRIRLFKQWGKKFIQKRIQQAKIKIKDKGTGNPPRDIIQALVRQGLNQPGSSDAYTQEEILEEFCTFLVAGTDTTSHLNLMMIYYITLNPEVEKKLREEIQQNIKEGDFKYDNLKNFKYIDYIQKQTLRMYGPITGIFMRQVQQDNILSGIQIFKNTYVSIQHIGNHYNQKYFKPERWISECNDLPAFLTGGFSAGGRNCIGKHLALIQSKIALITFYLRYKQVILPKKDFKMVLNFVYAPQSFKSKIILAQEVNPLFD